MERLKVVFILGSGHCGATLLDMLLDSHSAVFGVGEMHSARATSICTCGKVGPTCPLWLKVFGPAPWTVQALYRPKFRELFNCGPFLSVATHKPIDTNAFNSMVISQFRELLKETGKSIICDSSKEVERVEALALSPEIEPIVIHLVRDGRGATWTYINKYKRFFPFFYMWAFSNLKISLFRRRFKGTFLYLKMEDLVADPEGTLKKLCTVIGIPYEAGMLEFDKPPKPHHQIEGNRTRFVPGHVIYKDEKWRREIPTWLKTAFDICFGWLNLIYMHKKSFTAYAHE